MRFRVTASFLCLITVAQAVSLAKPGCPDKCGNVTIPYPFGIGSQCSANSSFTIICNYNSTPVLTSINVEALNISIESGLVAVKHPISPITCSSVQKKQSLGLSLQGSPFSFSEEHNSLLVLGCQNVVWLRGNETSTIGGCMAICDSNSTDTSCNGVNCCKTPIPEGRKEIEFTYQSINGFSSNGSCGYIFVAEHEWIRVDYKTHKRLKHNLLNPLDEEFRYATVVLDWKFSNYPNFSSHATDGCYNGRRRRNPTNMPDEVYYYYSNQPISRTQCSCRFGFEGNPYLSTGCTDIDECSEETRKIFCPGYPCKNTIGSYQCLYPDDKKSQGVKITLIVLGSVFGTLILLLVGGRSSRVVWRRIKANRRLKFFKRNGGMLLEKHLAATDGSAGKVKLFRSRDLAQATDHYNENRVLGRGGQGTVYKGMLTDGRIVAVKKSKMIDQSDTDIEVFINEVVILSQINHRNVVKLLGCCLETEVPLLVYEFIPNGTLFQHIHYPNEEFPLTWDMRVRIAIEVANCLAYLHSAASTPIYHRDIKSTNILLDDKYRAKVSDFGTSRSVAIDQTHLTTRVLGTFGYLDPEYFQSSQFTEKSDVYSFGVVMVELLTGMKAVSSVRAEVGMSLATHFLQSMEENDQLFEILDARVVQEGEEEEIVAMAKLARRCLNLNGKKRPTMKEVGAELEAIRHKKRAAFGDLQRRDSVEEKEHSFEIYESCDFSSISGFTDSKNIT